MPSPVNTILIATHHKSGTFLMRWIFQDYCEAAGLKYSVLTNPGSDPIVCVNPRPGVDGPEVLFDPQSHNIHCFARRADVSGVHLVRHPLNLILSAVAYHRITDEPWANEPRPHLGGHSIRQHMSMLSDDDALLFEIERSGATIMDMYQWDYEDARFLNLQFEDFQASFESMVARMSDHLGFSRDIMSSIAARHDLNKLSDKQILGMEHVTNKTRMPRKYAEHFRIQHYLRFSELYPKNLFTALGYPEPDGLSANR